MSDYDDVTNFRTTIINSIMKFDEDQGIWYCTLEFLITKYNNSRFNQSVSQLVNYLLNFSGKKCCRKRALEFISYINPTSYKGDIDQVHIIIGNSDDNDNKVFLTCNNNYNDDDNDNDDNDEVEGYQVEKIMNGLFQVTFSISNTDYDKALDFKYDINEENETDYKQIKVTVQPEVVTDQNESDDTSTTIIPGSGYIIPDSQISRLCNTLIISDIDDTVKVSGVVDKRTLAYIILHQNHKSVNGMAELYSKLYYEVGHEVVYASNSPVPMYKLLEQFFRHYGFPLTYMNLRPFQFGKVSFENFRGKETNKRGRILDTINQSSYRNVVLIGDSGEHDLEHYSDIAVSSFRRFLDEEGVEESSREFQSYSSGGEGYDDQEDHDEDDSDSNVDGYDDNQDENSDHEYYDYDNDYNGNPISYDTSESNQVQYSDTGSYEETGIHELNGGTDDEDYGNEDSDSDDEVEITNNTSIVRGIYIRDVFYDYLVMLLGALGHSKFTEGSFEMAEPKVLVNDMKKLKKTLLSSERALKLFGLSSLSKKGFGLGRNFLINGSNGNKWVKPKSDVVDQYYIPRKCIFFNTSWENIDVYKYSGEGDESGFEWINEDVRSNNYIGNINRVFDDIVDCYVESSQPKIEKIIRALRNIFDIDKSVFPDDCLPSLEQMGLNDYEDEDDEGDEDAVDDEAFIDPDSSNISSSEDEDDNIEITYFKKIRLHKLRIFVMWIKFIQYRKWLLEQCIENQPFECKLFIDGHDLHDDIFDLLEQCGPT